MKKISLAVIAAAAFLNLSFATVDQVGQRVGMITDSYGIVTDADLDEEEARCAIPAEPFPPNNLNINYWQCLPTRDIFMDCEDNSPSDDFDRPASAIFWIKDGENIHNYLTRRNFDMEVCEEWLQAWGQVIEGENEICFSGSFLSKRYSDGDKVTPPGMHYFWIIERMKSRHGEWSYFYRGPLNEDGSAKED